jgi:hypothetical protein
MTECQKDSTECCCCCCLLLQQSESPHCLLLQQLRRHGGGGGWAHSSKNSNMFKKFNVNKVLLQVPAKLDLTLKRQGVGGPKLPTEYGYDLYSFNFHQNFSNFFCESCLMSAFTQKFRNRSQVIHLSQKSMLSKTLIL